MLTQWNVGGAHVFIFAVRCYVLTGLLCVRDPNLYLQMLIKQVPIAKNGLQSFNGKHEQYRSEVEVKKR